MSVAALVDLLLAALCALWIAGAGFGWRVLRTVPVLSRQRPTQPPSPAPPPGPPGASRTPVLAILVPANDEAGDASSIAELRAAHASRLAAATRLAEANAAAGTGAAAPAVELIYIDDRSTDATGALLDEFAATAGTGPAVSVRTLHVRELPEGWLGKTHALQRALATLPAEGPGARAGAGSRPGDSPRAPRWVLFTDADVLFAPDALALALAHAEARGLEHLVVMPQLHPGGLLRDATLGAFGRLFGLMLASVNDPKSKASVGVGAFNLMRRSALARIGDMQRVRLEVGDDMALGALLRRSGARQGVASGRDLVHLTWYRSAAQIVRGLEKGIFAYGGRCEPWRLYLGAFALLVMELAPWIALARGPALCALGAAAIVLDVGIVAAGERWMGRRMLPALLVPVGGLIMAWAVARAGWMGARRGGVVWRGTLYPSAMLREAMAWEGGTRSGRRREA